MTVHAQLTYLTADPEDVSKVVQWVESGRDEHAESPGSLGMTLSAYAELGVVELVWFWVSGDAMREHEKALAPWRGRALSEGAATMSVERYRVAGHAAPHRPVAGGGVRTLRIETDPDRVPEVVQAYEDIELAWLLEVADGLCSSVLLLDPGTGRGWAQSIWRDARALVASRGQAAVARADAVAAAEMVVRTLEEQRVLFTTATLPRHDVGRRAG
jgi:hypothetical protein